VNADLFTIGYEGTSLGRVLAALRGAGVTHLVDIRAVPQSRKPGFSKRLLAASVAAAGMHYTHLRGLGTPKAGRDAVRSGEVARMHAIFGEHMRTHEAQADLAHAVAIAQAGCACLLCFERDHAHCHRDIVAGLIAATSGHRVTHLVADARNAGLRCAPSQLR
jgi:uncharacterized protein (DUF488 family)